MSNDELHYISIVGFQVIHNNLDVLKVVCQVAYFPHSARFMTASDGKLNQPKRPTRLNKLRLVFRQITSNLPEVKAERVQR